MDKAQNDRGERTIVGGRPRKRGLGGTKMPRGIEVLIKKASLDPAFCTLLLEQRATAARERELELTPAETAILDSVPEAQLQAMVNHTQVPDVQRRAFLGRLGAAMLSAVVAGCTPLTPETPTPAPTGIRPEDVTEWVRPTPTLKATPTPETVSTPTPVETDAQSAPEDKPTAQVVRGIRPDRP